MLQYVCGFLFNKPGSQVLLIQKERPLWQKGQLNGIGGQLLHGESGPTGMIREFREETGVEHEIDWQLFCMYQTTTSQGYRIQFYRAFDTTAMLKARSVTDEKLQRREVDKLPPLQAHKIIWNLRWLIPLALDPDLEFPIMIKEHKEADKYGKRAPKNTG